jgi:hypothetical protein
MKGPGALSNDSLGIGPGLSEREQESRLSELLVEARDVGRAACTAALEAGEDVDSAARRPDGSVLLAALRRTLPAHFSTPPEPAHLSTPPERSLTQRLVALERANEVRTMRAQLKRDLKGGRCSIHAVLTDPPSYVETAKVFDMLLTVPGYGRVKANKVLAQCRIAPSKTIGGLSQRQRDELVSLLRR